MDIKKIKEKIINRETILYAISGGLTFVVGIVVYNGLLFVGVEYKIANLCSLILSKLFAYVMNKLVVFRCKNNSFGEFCKEFLRFVIARGTTALIDYFGVVMAVELWNWDKIISKYFFMVFVIILNYFFGKKIVFKGRKSETENQNNE